jgi:hypothetical protein
VWRSPDPDRFGPGHAIGAPEQLDRSTRVAFPTPARSEGVEGEIGRKCNELGWISTLREAESFFFHPAPTLYERVGLTTRGRSRLVLFPADQQPHGNPCARPQHAPSSQTGRTRAPVPSSARTTPHLSVSMAILSVCTYRRSGRPSGYNARECSGFRRGFGDATSQGQRVSTGSANLASGRLRR